MSTSLLGFLLLAQAPLGGVAAPDRLAWGDFDLDGRLDVVALEEDGLKLLHNEGDGSLADWTARAGLAGVQGGVDAQLVDVDVDGVPDLLVVVSRGESRLLLQRDGVFQDAGHASGLDLGPGILRQRWIDWNGDARPDLSLRTLGGERFYENQGDGSFRELLSALAPGIATLPLRSTSADGRPDAAVDDLAATGATPAGGQVRGTPLRQVPLLICAQGLADDATGDCLQASSVPTEGMLYPLGPELMIDGAGQVGIGTTSPAWKLDVTGEIGAQQLTLTALSGPPLVVSSSTKVTDLNVDQLDGLDSADFFQVGAGIGGAEILDDSITDDDVSPAANIAGTKIVPDFGVRDVETDGRVVVNGGAGATARVSVRATALDGLVSATTSSTGYGVGGFATSATGDTQGVYGETSSVDGVGIEGRATALTGDAAGVRGTTTADGGTGVSGVAWQSSGTTNGVSGTTHSTQGVGVRAFASQSTGATRGVLGQANSSSGTGVYGLALAPTGSTYGVRGESASTTLGVGVSGRATASTGFGTGVSGVTDSSDGIGVAASSTATSGFPRALVATISASAGVAVQGVSLSSTGSAIGVEGQSGGLNGIGVRGDHSGTTGNLSGSRGVSGSVVSANGTGVWGEGNSSTTSDGVRGTAPNSGGYGVYGVGQNGANGVVGSASGGGAAVRAIGDLTVTGTKNFVQPHPTDGAREIRFVSLEGNESGSYFRGSGRLVGGSAVIDVPEEFRLVTVAQGLTVQLTAIGAPARLFVVSRDLNQIVVRGDLDVDFDYFVNGVRRGFDSFQSIQANRSFQPRVADRPFGKSLPDLLRQDLVRTGVLNADFTPSRAFAATMGWELSEPAAPVDRRQQIDRDRSAPAAGR